MYLSIKKKIYGTLKNFFTFLILISMTQGGFALYAPNLQDVKYKTKNY